MVDIRERDQRATTPNEFSHALDSSISDIPTHPNTLNPQNSEDVPQINTVNVFMGFLQAEYPSIEKAWEKFGLLTSENANIKEHNTVAASVAYRLGILLHLPENDLKKVALATALHDCDKAEEIGIINAIIKKVLLDTQKTEEIAHAMKYVKQQRQEVLSTLGFQQDVIDLSGANMPLDRSSDTPLFSIEEIAQALMPKDRKAQIVFVVDLFLNGSRIVPVQERFAASRDSTIHPDRAYKNALTDKANAEVYGVDSYQDLQFAIGRTIMREFLQELTNDPKYLTKDPLEALPDFISQDFAHLAREISTSSSI